jgi:hypothetical protein
MGYGALFEPPPPFGTLEAIHRAHTTPSVYDLTMPPQYPCRYCRQLIEGEDNRNEHERRAHNNYQWASNPSTFDGTHDWSYCVPPPKTACKHGLGDCEICGTSSRRDYRHKTVGGKGVIARIK